jgi:16S rRNA (uracil1498-N3)-methyltransferase
MQLFFISEFPSGDIELDAEESRHIIKVLRKRAGDSIQFTDGKGMLAQAVLTSTDKHSCIAKIISKQQIERPRPLLHIGIAPTKNHDRFEWCIEKCTEIGISSITPLLCEHSERPQLKFDRLQKIVQSALKQSNQYYTPHLAPLTTFTDFIKNNDSPGSKFIAWCGDGDKSTPGQIPTNTDTTILIGPEGDFSQSEISLALAEGYKSLSLGNNRLRTETAALMACAAFQTVNL